MIYYIVASYIAMAGFVHANTSGHRGIEGFFDAVRNIFVFVLAPVTLIFLIGAIIGFMYKNVIGIDEDFMHLIE